MRLSDNTTGSAKGRVSLAAPPDLHSQPTAALETPFLHEALQAVGSSRRQVAIVQRRGVRR